jgi:hypothetical protein
LGYYTESKLRLTIDLAEQITMPGFNQNLAIRQTALNMIKSTYRLTLIERTKHQS